MLEIKLTRQALRTVNLKILIKKFNLKNREKIFYKYVKISVLWENIDSNIHVIRLLEESEKIKREKHQLKKMEENFPNLMENIKLQIQEPQQTPCKMNTKKTMSRHSLAKFLKTKDKEKVLKSCQRKKSHKGIMVQLITDFSTDSGDRDSVKTSLKC